MRLIDMRRTRRLADSYYRIIRAKGYSDELNVSEDELRRMLGVTNLRYDNSGYAELNFSTENHIPYTKLDGTLEADIAAIKDSVDEPIDMVTGQLVMTGSAMPLSETSLVVHTLVLVPRWGDMFLGGQTVTDETGVFVPESLKLKNKDLADLYVIGNEGDILTWTAW